MMLDPDAWLARAQARVAATALAPEIETIGRVSQHRRRHRHVSGLPQCAAGRAAAFRHGPAWLRPDARCATAIGCVLLDPAEGVAAGTVVRGTGDVVRTPVGPGLLGRVVDPLGRPLDGGPPIAAEHGEPIEQPAPDIVDRAWLRSRCRPASW